METKKVTKKAATTKAKTSGNRVEKKMSKFMQGALKYQGAFDKEEVNKYLALHES